MTKVMVYSRADIMTLPGRDQEEGSGRVCSGLGVFLGFRFTLKLSEFGSLQGSFNWGWCSAALLLLGSKFAQLLPSLGFFVVFQALPSFSWNEEQGDISGLCFRCLFYTSN